MEQKKHTYTAMKWAALAILLAACGTDSTDEPQPDAASTVDASSTVDANLQVDLGPSEQTDAGPDGALTDARPFDAATDTLVRDTSEEPRTCKEVSIRSWTLERSEDVRIGYDVIIHEPISGHDYTLRLWVERYNDTEYEGEFDMGVAPENNFGTCTKCLWAYAASNPSAPFFVESGTLKLLSNPWNRTLHAEGHGLRFVQVTVDAETRESTPVPGGQCFELADFNVHETFLPDGWTCDAQFYGDGQCHCDCGDFDPDCAGVFPDIEPPEAVDCTESEVCADHIIVDDGPFLSWGHRSCLPRCDVTTANSCAEGTTCLVDDQGLGTDRCSTDDVVLSPVNIGEECTGIAVLQLYCNVVDGAARGYCDYANTCRSLCANDAECDGTGFDCIHFLGESGWGHCGPPAPDEEPE